MAIFSLYLYNLNEATEFDQRFRPEGIYTLATIPMKQNYNAILLSVNVFINTGQYTSACSQGISQVDRRSLKYVVDY